MSRMIADRYLLASELGQGGMADVYLAMDTVLNREVAVKLLRGELSADPVALLRFQREANAASQLNHPNIVEIYDVGEFENKPYIVMEYVRGKTLKQLISQRKALDVKEASTIMKQLISAVSAAHKSNIIHRDIKPQNVLVKDDGTAKITDFGIAQTQDAVQLTQTDSVMGSVHYLAPELARGESASFQSDIYSLGVVFYELLTGRVPYSAESAVQIAMMHMEKDFPSVRDFDKNIPQSIENIIIKATAKNKNYRYHSAEDMLKDLEAALKPEHAHDEKLLLSQEYGKTKAIQKVSHSLQTDSHAVSVQSIILAALSVIAALLLFVMIFLITMQNHPKVMEMPDLANKTLTEAQPVLEEMGLSLGKVSYAVTDDIEKGLIVSTSPSSGMDVEKGSAINIVVSDGIYFVIGDYAKMTEEEVRELLANRNIDIQVEKEDREDMEAGIVLRQEVLHPGDKCDPNRHYSLKLIVSDYPSFVMPSNLLGMDVYQAQALLEGKGARVILYPLDFDKLSPEQQANTARGVVSEFTPNTAYYTQREGSAITLYYY